MRGARRRGGARAGRLRRPGQRGSGVLRAPRRRARPRRPRPLRGRALSPCPQGRGRARRPPPPPRSRAPRGAPTARRRTGGRRRGTARQRSPGRAGRAPSAHARRRRARPAVPRRRSEPRRRVRPARAAATGTSWLCSVQTTTGMPSSASGSSPLLLRESRRRLQRRVGQRHDVRPGLRVEAEPAREVGVEDVEAARAEPELARLDVDEHLVAERDGAGQARVGDAGLTVDLAADEPLMPLEHGRDGSPPQPERHQPVPLRAASTSASVTSTIPSRSATEMCSSDEWMLAIPFARFRHWRPRSLKTFASAPPPERTSRGS